MTACTCTVYSTCTAEISRVIILWALLSTYQIHMNTVEPLADTIGTADRNVLIDYRCVCCNSDKVLYTKVILGLGKVCLDYRGVIVSDFLSWESFSL